MCGGGEHVHVHVCVCMRGYVCGYVHEWHVFMHCFCISNIFLCLPEKYSSFIHKKIDK